MKILLIEDNQTIAGQLVEFLELQHWKVDYAHNGDLGIQLALSENYDVILLDLNLPDIDGLNVCSTIKEKSERIPPILMLTARDSFDDKSLGFNHGADDYLTKPYDMRELKLRCEALARRQNLYQSKIIELGPLYLNLTEKKALRETKELKLTNIGFDILKTLVKAYPNPVSRSQLEYIIWKDDPPDTDALKSHIYSLRKSLDKPFNKAILQTVMNVGFKLDID